MVPVSSYLIVFARQEKEFWPHVLVDAWQEKEIWPHSSPENFCSWLEMEIYTGLLVIICILT